MRKASNVMTERLRYEYQRAMDPLALHSFVHELFFDNKPPSLADMMYIAKVQSWHYVVDSHGRIALTAEFAYSEIDWPSWRSQPWPQRQRRLSKDDMSDVVTAITNILRKVHNHFLRTDVLYFHVRKAFSCCLQPPSMKEHRDVLDANQDVLLMDSDGYVHLAEAYVRPAADGAHGEEQQSSKRARLAGLQASNRNIHFAEAPHQSAADAAHREEPE